VLKSIASVPMNKLSVDILGGFTVRRSDGEPVELPTRKAQALIAFLALTGTTAHTREKLASLLWNASGPEQARQSLRQTLFTIRRAFGEELSPVALDNDSVSIDASRLSVDALEFERLVQAGTIESLTDAVALWKGELLDGLALSEENFDDWATAQRERYHELAFAANSRLLAHQQLEERDDQVVLTCKRLLALDPLQEQIHRTLMQTYMRQRRYASAIKQYQACAAVVRRQLGISPEAETNRLYDDLLRLRNRPSGEEPKPAIKQILVVEDNALGAKLIRAYLEGSDYRVTVAGDGGQALLEIGRSIPDLILLDIDLPVVDGLTLLDVLRRNELSIPTILMTAMPGEQTEVKGLDLGAADFIRKPVQKAVLLKRIEKALRAARTSGIGTAVNH
jgi:DNA-binding SARP family transcriptional activator